MPALTRVSQNSVLFITLDSCRYDTFIAAKCQNLKAIGRTAKAHAPGYFTLSSHAAMFVGFTPSASLGREPIINPKYAKLFRMIGGGFASRDVRPVFTLEGRSIVEGFRLLGYWALGTGAVGWFDPALPTGRILSQDFHEFFYPGNSFAAARQVAWVRQRLSGFSDDVFLFCNVGETHVPYYHEDAPWDPSYNPCVPFAESNSAEESRRRQIACLEYLDRCLAPLLEMFADATILLCADHGDAWGEDGAWEHGFCHPKVIEVPLAFRLPRHLRDLMASPEILP